MNQGLFNDPIVRLEEVEKVVHKLVAQNHELRQHLEVLEARLDRADAARLQPYATPNLAMPYPTPAPAPTPYYPPFGQPTMPGIFMPIVGDPPPQPFVTY